MLPHRMVVLLHDVGITLDTSTPKLERARAPPLGLEACLTFNKPPLCQFDRCWSNGTSVRWRSAVKTRLLASHLSRSHKTRQVLMTSY